MVETKKLIDIADVFDSLHQTPEYVEIGIPMVRVTDVKSGDLSLEGCQFVTDEVFEKFTASHVPQKGDIVISRVGTYGNFSYVAEKLKFCLGQNTSIIVPKINPRYLYYYLRSPFARMQIESRVVGSTQKTLSLKNIKELEIPCPDRIIQDKIASFLETIDLKIDNNNRINRNLSEQVAALYKAWFIDFERNDGVCPEEWKEATLGDIAEIGSGKRPPMKQTDKTDDVCIPLIGAASIMGYTNSVLYDSKILVTGRVGTHGVVQRFNNECWPSDNTLVITTDKYEFVNQILLGIDYKSMNRGSTQPLITQGDLKKTEIILPTDAILDEFEALAGGLMNQYEKNILENAKLSELRDTLLPKLMSGELDVSDMDF